jgi:hypothetical protein
MRLNTGESAIGYRVHGTASGKETIQMLDLLDLLDPILLAVGLGFFALSIGYVYACDRL